MNSLKNHGNSTQDLDSDAISLDKLANQFGFICHSYQVVTTDGYILSLWRIPGKLDKTSTPPLGMPILLQHGIMADMMQWFWHSSQMSPAFILANQGYDIWLGNNRGNRFSTGHVDPNQLDTQAYWQFSFEEMGVYDLKAMIDYIVEVTEYKQIMYIGYADGATQLLAAASLMSDFFKARIALATLIAPVTRLSNGGNKVFKYLSHPNEFLDHLMDLFKNYGIYNILPFNYNKYLKYNIICLYLSILSKSRFCKNLIEEFLSLNIKYDDLHTIPRIKNYFPSGSSVYNFVHYDQILKSGKFSRFDYGLEKNMQMYNQLNPPLYDLSYIDFPVAIFSSVDDQLASLNDIIWLQDQLGENVVYSNQYPFGRSTFLIGYSEYMKWIKDDLSHLIKKYVINKVSYNNKVSSDCGSIYSDCRTSFSEKHVHWNEQIYINSKIDYNISREK